MGNGVRAGWPLLSFLQHMFTDPYNLAAVVMTLISVSVLLHRKLVSPMRSARIVRPRGFTLIELIIVIAIVALLVAVALPSYRDHMRKSRRAEAQAYLMAIAGRQQQFLIDSRGYAATLATINIPQPASVVAAYDVTLAVVTGPPPTFLLTAAPKSGTDQTLERCGTLTIDQTGAKTASLTSCW
jgi:type IV pilus assembly protein PilE